MRSSRCILRILSVCTHRHFSCCPLVSATISPWGVPQWLFRCPSATLGGPSRPHMCSPSRGAFPEALPSHPFPLPRPSPFQGGLPGQRPSCLHPHPFPRLSPLQSSHGVAVTCTGAQTPRGQGSCLSDSPSESPARGHHAT